jgi:lipoate-protein ligase A
VRELSCLRLIIDPPLPGPRNMAIDELLLNHVVEHNLITLRFYQWNEPTLSIGYFQQYADRQLHKASSACAVVRRQTGGGAILHDHELTYSLAVPPAHRLARDTQQLYFAVHQVIIKALMKEERPLQRSQPLALWQHNSQHSRTEEPFLCFQRRSRGDVVFSRSNGAQEKVVGSAQRRRRGAILQHGSILLARSIVAPELPGLTELSKIQMDVHTLTDRLQNLLPMALAIPNDNVEICESTHLFESGAKALATSKYGTEAWLKRR